MSHGGPHEGEWGIGHLDVQGTAEGEVAALTLPQQPQVCFISPLSSTIPTSNFSVLWCHHCIFLGIVLHQCHCFEVPLRGLGLTVYLQTFWHTFIKWAYSGCTEKISYSLDLGPGVDFGCMYVQQALAVDSAPAAKVLFVTWIAFGEKGDNGFKTHNFHSVDMRCAGALLVNELRVNK